MGEIFLSPLYSLALTKKKKVCTNNEQQKRRLGICVYEMITHRAFAYGWFEQLHLAKEDAAMWPRR